jgi:hypothetical protein
MALFLCKLLFVCFNRLRISLGHINGLNSRELFVCLIRVIDLIVLQILFVQILIRSSVREAIALDWLQGLVVLQF